MKLSLIAAVNQDGVIGKNGGLPWYLPEDLAYFKRITMGKPIVMGRKTFESIGRVLPGRVTIVLTRQQDWSHPGVLVADSVTSAIALAGSCDELMVVGGQAAYEEALPLADTIYLTEVQLDVPNGDAFFPMWVKSDWKATSVTNPENPNSIPYRFIVFERP